MRQGLGVTLSSWGQQHRRKELEAELSEAPLCPIPTSSLPACRTQDRGQKPEQQLSWGALPLSSQPWQQQVGCGV